MTQVNTPEAEHAMAKAQEVLYSQVFVPAFVKLAAEKGISITTEEELTEAIKIATMIESAQQNQGTGSLLKQASQALESRLYGSQKQNASQAFVKQASQLKDVREAIANVNKTLK